MPVGFPDGQEELQPSKATANGLSGESADELLLKHVLLEEASLFEVPLPPAPHLVLPAQMDPALVATPTRSGPLPPGMKPPLPPITEVFHTRRDANRVLTSRESCV